MITLKLVACETREPAVWVTHYYPVVVLAGPTTVRWHGADYLATATDWNDSGQHQLLVLDNGWRVPALSAVIRQMVGDELFEQVLLEAAALELSAWLLRGVSLYRQQSIEGVDLIVDSTRAAPLHFAACFLRAYSPNVPVKFRLRSAAGALAFVDV